MLPPLVPESDGRGSLTVAIHGAALPGRADTYTYFRLQLENPHQKYDLMKDVALKGEVMPVSFENIALGTWRLTVHLIEEENVEGEDGTIAITHTGVQDVNVSTERVHIDVQLLPNPGELELFMNLGEDCILIQDATGCLADENRAARFVTEPDFKQTNKGDFLWPAGASTHTVTVGDVPLGSYELQLTFWEGTRTGKHLFQSGWISFDIFPGRRTRLEWRPDVGSVVIGLVILGPPPPPFDVAISIEQPKPRLTWTGPDALVERYNIYAKGPGQDAFCLVGETEGTTTQWPLPDGNEVHCGDGEKGFAPSRYAVTSVNEDGYESVRSAEAITPVVPPTSN